MASISGWRVTRAGILFAIIVVVLGLLVFAVAAYVQQRGEQVRREEAAKIAQENLDEQSDTPVIAEDTPKEEATSGGQTAGEGSADQNGQLVTAGQPAVLPETGVDVRHIIAITALTGATAFFISSRRAVREL